MDANITTNLRFQIDTALPNLSNSPEFILWRLASLVLFQNRLFNGRFFLIKVIQSPPGQRDESYNVVALQVQCSLLISYTVPELKDFLLRTSGG